MVLTRSLQLRDSVSDISMSLNDLVFTAAGRLRHGGRPSSQKEHYYLEPAKMAILVSSVSGFNL